MSFALSELALRVEQSRAAERAAQDQAEKFDRKSRSIGHLRGLTFLASLLALGSTFMAEDDAVQLAAGGLAFAAFIGFLVLIRRHDACIAELERAEREAAVYRARAIRQEGSFTGLEDTGRELAPVGHPYAADLDLFGEGSLFQRISVAHTHFGREALAERLTNPAEPETIVQRQAAVAELARMPEFRTQLEREARALVQIHRKGKATVRETPDPSALLRWMEQPRGLPSSPVYRLACLLLPVSTLAALTASIALSAPPYYLIPLVIGLVLLARAKDVTGPTFGIVSQTEGSFLPYGDLLRLIEELRPEAPLLQKLLADLKGAPREHSAGAAKKGPSSERSGLSASAEMRAFRDLVSWYDIRHNGMVYPFIEAIFLWSIHSTLRLEDWKARIGGQARRWFLVLAELETLCSLAELYDIDPMAELPMLAADGATLEAAELGHPLIAPSKRKTNDLPGLAPGHGLLITGSNMSGKSTFLRALGVNAVLALAGGPVTAKSFTLPPLLIRTSLRIEDSLLSGTSHFFAEVKKLAQAVESVRGDARVLFLLDEVLHGTNSRERVIGARWVLAELLAHGAFGIMTTHDEGLTSFEGNLAERVQLFHFREDVQDGKMSFDYVLRSGPVRSGNALRLMRSVGLDVPIE